MIHKVLENIDDVISQIKSKDDLTQTFKIEVARKFEFYLLLSLDIARFELQTKEVLTDLTADALTQLFVFQTFEYYNSQYTKLYESCLNLFYVFSEYNEKLKNNTLPCEIGVWDAQWISYFRRAITNIIENTEPRNIQKPLVPKRSD